MKIKDLIKILELAPDEERELYVTGENRCWTTNIGFSFDDNNDIQLYEIVIDELGEYKLLNS